MKIIVCMVLLVFLTSCSEFALLLSAGSVAASQNTYSKAFSAVDFGVVVKTKKDIKTHVYDKIKKNGDNKKGK